MNMLDLISAAYVAYGAWRGQVRGFADEGYRLLRMTIAFVAGCGLYRMIADAMRSIISYGGDFSGSISFLAAIAGAWYLSRVLKTGVMRFLDSRLSGYSRLGGFVSGGARALLIVLSIVGALRLAGHDPGRDRISERSIVSRLAEKIMPGD